MTANGLILVTSAAGRIGNVGGAVVEGLLRRGLPVRALVRREDERAEALRATGAEVVVGDLTHAQDIARALEGCRSMYFGMSVSAPYLEATVTAAAVAREHGELEAFVNMSQLTVSQMSLTNMTDSRQQRLHWLAEPALNWSGLPVVHVALLRREREQRAPPVAVDEDVAMQAERGRGDGVVAFVHRSSSVRWGCRQSRQAT